MLLTAGASFLRAASERDWATMRMYMVLLFWSHGFSAGTPMLVCFHQYRDGWWEMMTAYRWNSSISSFRINSSPICLRTCFSKRSHFSLQP